MGRGRRRRREVWLGVLTEIKNRGVEDRCLVVCDGLRGLPDSIGAGWPLATVQTCLLHLIRNTFRYASRRDWDAIAKQLRPVYTAPTAAAADERFADFTATWAGQYPAIIALCRHAWDEFVPFLDYDVEIRRIVCSTNAIESLNARYRRAVRARGHFPTEQAALKCLYLATRALDRPDAGRHAGRSAGSPPSTPSPSPIPAASSPPPPTNRDQLHRCSDSSWPCPPVANMSDVGRTVRRRSLAIRS